MYSIVLATVLTAGSTAPDLGWRTGCYGCWGCSGCYGYSSCYGCYGCSGCYGCWGGCYGYSSCYGCWGGCYGGCYGGCWGCSGCYGCSGYSSCYGCWGGCYGGCSGCYGGCWGGCYGSWGYACSGCYGYSSCYGCGGCWGGWGCGGCYGVSYGCEGYGCAGLGYAGPVDRPMMKKIEDGKNGKDGKDGEGDVRASEPATVVVKAPRDVTVTFNGQETTRSSEVESFQTPALAPGRTYAYSVKAEVVRDGKKVSRSKRILVRAGGRSRVDFSDLDSASASADSDNDSARVTVLLPAGSKLYVDGRVYGTNSKQTFTTPKLAKGKLYYYTMKAERLSDNKADSRRVTVQAGKEVTVDFRDRSVVSADR